MTLFEINQEIENCLSINEETGETEFDESKFNELLIEREAKLENLANWIINLKSDIEQLAGQIKVFQERKKTIENKLERVKTFLSANLNGEKRSYSSCQISWRKSDSIVVDDVYKVDKEYYKEQIPEVDKMAIKSALKDGKTIDGIHIESKNSIIIK